MREKKISYFRMSSYEDQQKNLEKLWADLLATEAAEENCNESEGSDNNEVETIC